MRFVHAMWQCDTPLAEHKHGRVGTLMLFPTGRQDTASRVTGRLGQWLDPGRGGTPRFMLPEPESASLQFFGITDTIA